MHAARSAKMVQLLLDYNADPDSEDEIGHRPLHRYAIRHDITAMQAILQQGAEVDPLQPYEKPLHQAATRVLDTVELSVEYGADVQERNRNLQENTPLNSAAAWTKTDVVFLVEWWPEDTRATNFNGHCTIKVVEFLVKGWPEAMGEKNQFGKTPLHMVAGARRGNPDVVRFLVEH
jgi:ankyrin repeat protein